MCHDVSVIQSLVHPVWDGRSSGVEWNREKVEVDVQVHMTLLRREKHADRINRVCPSGPW